jgi:hypothetical protein
MDAVVQSNAAQTEELSSTARSLNTQAQRLQALVSKFKLSEGQITRPPALAAAAQTEGQAAAFRPSIKPAARYEDSLTVMRQRGNGASGAHAGAFEEF